MSVLAIAGYVLLGLLVVGLVILASYVSIVVLGIAIVLGLLYLVGWGVWSLRPAEPAQPAQPAIVQSVPPGPAPDGGGVSGYLRQHPATVLGFGVGLFAASVVCLLAAIWVIGRRQRNLAHVAAQSVPYPDPWTDQYGIGSSPNPIRASRPIDKPEPIDPDLTI
jgi:hypothetical protein